MLLGDTGTKVWPASLSETRARHGPRYGPLVNLSHRGCSLCLHYTQDSTRFNSFCLYTSSRFPGTHGRRYGKVGSFQNHPQTHGQPQQAPLTSRPWAPLSLKVCFLQRLHAGSWKLASSTTTLVNQACFCLFKSLWRRVRLPGPFFPSNIREQLCILEKGHNCSTWLRSNPSRSDCDRQP